MTLIVADCSLVASWFFEDEGGVADKVLDGLSDFVLHVPSLWPIEICNVLRTAEKQKTINGKDITKIFSFLDSLPIEVDSWDYWANRERYFQMAHQLNLTAYDAAYIELALRLDIPLATLDKELSQAARKLKIPTL